MFPFYSTLIANYGNAENALLDGVCPPDFNSRSSGKNHSKVDSNG